MVVMIPKLDESIKNHLAPVLRSDGYKGSGRNYRSGNLELLSAINIQGNRYGGSFAINLGIHPVGIPDNLGNIPDPKKIIEVDCVFRRRLSQNGSDCWWSYENTQESMDSAIKNAADLYMLTGRKLLQEMAGLSSPILHITTDQFVGNSYDLLGFSPPRARLAYILALLHNKNGDIVKAKIFANEGLKIVGNASVLQAQLQSIIQS